MSRPTRLTPASPPSRTPRSAPPIRWPSASAWNCRGSSPARPPRRRKPRPKRKNPNDSRQMILTKRPDVDRFLKGPPAEIRAALIWGRDRGGVRERADALAGTIAPVPDDPFNVALLTETDIDRDAARLEEELSALSLTGGRRLIRLRL